MHQEVKGYVWFPENDKERKKNKKENIKENIVIFSLLISLKKYKRKKEKEQGKGEENFVGLLFEASSLTPHQWLCFSPSLPLSQTTTQRIS